MPLERTAAVSLRTLLRDPTDSGRQPTARQPAAPATRASTAPGVVNFDLPTTDALPGRIGLPGALATGLGRPLDVGDVLLVKVLGIAPELELAVLDTGARSRGSASTPERDQPAMRSDQLAWQRQLVSRPPEAVALAASWRSSMLDQIDPPMSSRLPPPWAASDASARTPPPSPADADIARQQGQSAALYEPAPYNPLLRDAQRWLLTAYAWGGLRVLLRLLAVESDAATPQRRQGGSGAEKGADPARAAIAIRLALVLTDLGGVVVQLQLAPGGVLLDFAVERAQSVQALHDKLPTVIAGVARAELRVLRCRVATGLLGEAPAHTASAHRSTTADAALGLLRLVQSHPSPGAALPLDLFRAAAEVVLALSSL